MNWISQIEILSEFGELDRYLKGDLWYKSEQIFQALCRKYSELCERGEPKFILGSKNFYLAMEGQWDFTEVSKFKYIHSFYTYKHFILSFIFSF